MYLKSAKWSTKKKETKQFNAKQGFFAFKKKETVGVIFSTYFGAGLSCF